jgi:predicted RNA binding protein YcfA (HicA-like mRNA interferase family)
VSKKDKLIEKFRLNPSSVRYNEIILVLQNIWFEKLDAKWSHVKFKHLKMNNDIIIPVHNWECKDFYKKQTLKILQNNSLI